MYILQPRNIEQRQVVHITQDRPFALFDNDAVTPVVGAGIVTRLRAKRPGAGGSISCRDRYLSLHCVQTDFGFHQLRLKSSVLERKVARGLIMPN